MEVGLTPGLGPAGWQVEVVSRGPRGKVSACLHGRCECGGKCRAACRHCSENPRVLS